ncbi:integrase core domain-containing protein [Autumnicola musiva]|uniref:integrase core domain-containing protein n=1 Tax=Autumnicola musiva TaxID=3075589 RepID=UPI003D77EE29
MEFSCVLSWVSLHDHWREDYNGFRPHSSLKDMPPNEYIEKKENSSDFLLLTSS